MAKHDITIIGGGLAGSTAGILLAQRGFSVRILEKNISLVGAGLKPAPTKQMKVCGEFLSPSIWPFLERFNLAESVLRLGGQQIRSVIFSGARELRFNLPIVHPNFPFGYGISRNILDPFLLNAAREAGCEILEMEGSAKDLLKENKILIQASGRSCLKTAPSPQPSPPTGARGNLGSSHPTLKENLNFPLSPLGRGQGEGIKIGFKVHFDGPAIGDSIKLFFFDGGYFGLVDVEDDQVNCCGIVQKQALKKYGYDFDHLLEQAADQNPAFGDWLSKARKKMEWITCAPLIHGKRNQNYDGIFHVGDAACFVEPFLGQGMTMALATSFALDACLKKIPSGETEWNAVIDRYDSMLNALYRSRVGIGNILNAVAFSLKKSSWSLAFFSRLPFLGQRLIEKTCGLPAETLLCPSN